MQQTPHTTTVVKCSLRRLSRRSQRACALPFRLRSLMVTKRMSVSSLCSKMWALTCFVDRAPSGKTACLRNIERFYSLARRSRYVSARGAGIGNKSVRADLCCRTMSARSFLSCLHPRRNALCFWKPLNRAESSRLTEVLWFDWS